MIIKLKQNISHKKLNDFLDWLNEKGFDYHINRSLGGILITLLNYPKAFDEKSIKAWDIVQDIKRVEEPYKYASRSYKREDSIIDVNGIKIGGDNTVIIAGPCSVESKEQIIEIAKKVKKSGANILRGGAYKPRTSPYSFQGKGLDGIELLLLAKKETGLPIVSEIMDASDIDKFEGIDILQVGARNMQNFSLLKALGEQDKPVLLKRGLSSTYEELLLSAEHILARGNPNVILCERGIRTFETATRNTLDITAVPWLKERTHLPIIVDPSHAAGIYNMVRPLSMAAISSGCDGLMIEVHNDPVHALSDGAQSINPERFDSLVDDLFKLKDFLNNENIKFFD